MMKTRLALPLALMIALTLTACGGNSTRQSEQSDTSSVSTPAATEEQAAQSPSEADGERVTFPDRFAEGVLYATIDRGNVTEEIFTSRAAIEAVMRGVPIPSGTVITVVEYKAKLDDQGNLVRDASGRLVEGELSRYWVKEKRTGWGAEYPPEKRNGEWEYQAFNADKSVNKEADLNSCFACHISRKQQDFLYTFDQMKSEPTPQPTRESTSVKGQEESTPVKTEDSSGAEQNGNEEADSMRIRLTVGDKVLTATLRDNETTRDFTSLLPLTLTLNDYAGTEKISDLPKRLSTKDAPPGSDPSVGDITYYAPWGNLAMYYRDFGYSNGLVILGKIDGGIEALHVPGSVKVTVELFN